MACINHPDSNDVKTIVNSISSVTSSRHIDQSITNAKRILKELNQLRRSAKTSEATSWANREITAVERKIKEMETLQARKEQEEQSQQLERERQYQAHQEYQLRELDRASNEQLNKQYQTYQEDQLRELDRTSNEQLNKQYQTYQEDQLRELDRTSNEQLNKQYHDKQMMPVISENQLDQFQTSIVEELTQSLNEINAAYQKEILDKYKDGNFSRDKSPALIGTDVHNHQLSQVVKEVLSWYGMEEGLDYSIAKPGEKRVDVIADSVQLMIECKPDDTNENILRKYREQLSFYQSQHPEYALMFTKYKRLK